MDIRSKDSSDEDHRSRRKKTVEDKRKKKRRYSSTDSYSSDESSSDSYSSDSDSESDSSDTSSSSDHRHKRRKRTSRKDKYRHGKKKEPKRQRGKKKKSISKSKLGPEPPSSSESGSTSSTNSDSKKSDRRGERRKDTQPLQAAGPSTRTDIMHKEKEPERPKKNEQITSKDGPSDEEGEVLRTKDVTKDGHSLETKSDKIRRSNRSPIENSNENQNANPLSGKATSPDDKKTNPSKSPARGPGYDVSEPTLKQGQDASGNDSLNGAPKRIRKGRGFTEKYHYVRKYRSPSPERTSIQSNYYRARNEYRRDWNRYPNPRQRNYNEHGSRQRNYNEHSPPRVYRGSPRGSSPNRYRSRRARSRSISRSPVRYHGQRDNSRSPRTRRSTLHDRRPADDRPSHDLQGRVHQTGRGRSKSRSRSQGSGSKSPDHAGKVNNMGKRNRKSRSSSRSSSPGNNGLVSYGDGSPDS